MAPSPRSRRRAPGMWGSAEQLPSGRWRAFYRQDGRKYSAPRTFETKAEAHAWLATERADRARGLWRDPDDSAVTLAEFGHAWLAARPDLSPRTRDLYARTLETWVLPHVSASDGARGVELGAMPITDISPAVVRAWYAAVFTRAQERATARAARERARASHPARAWAIARGLSVPVSGRIPERVFAAWRCAGAPLPTVHRPVPENAGESAAANAYRLLRTLMNTALTDGLIPSSPCQLKGAGQARHRERGTASPAEVAALAAHMPARLAAAVTVAAWSGLRAGELFALARRHVDIDRGTLHVERALIQLPSGGIAFGRPKTVKSRREIHLPRFVLEALERHLREFVPDAPDALVFALEGGAPVSASRRSVLFGRARKAIGRPDLTWHDLRHTGATLAYRAGASLPDVQRRLGHTTNRAAQIYAHAVDDSDQLLAARLDAMFSAASGTDSQQR
ncbi:tyrosine-type recombinase/integrase [Microbacterium sp. F2]|uniref:tyrosine-type recombinase/integrase n=1 Tax=Microbacterium sp. F2 TaxID=3422228 RepID=UPI003FD3062D